MIYKGHRDVGYFRALQLMLTYFRKYGCVLRKTILNFPLVFLKLLTWLWNGV